MIIYRTKDEPKDIKIEKIYTNDQYSVVSNSYEQNLSGIKFFKYADDIGYPLSLKNNLIQDTINFGGKTISNEDFVLIAGPCSAESVNQIVSTAKFMKDLGVQYFRAGCFKPRTKPYTFQGLGEDGLKLVSEVCKEYDLKFVSEVRDFSNLSSVIEYADVVQVGSKCMYDTGVLKELGGTSKSVLLKRHFGATLKEFLQAADFILSSGNTNIALCERGIRSFENDTRFTLDSCGIEWLKENSWIPIIGDPSHALGSTYGIEGLALSMISQKVNGLIIEVHPKPEIALSDSSQQLNFDEYSNLYSKMNKLRKFVLSL